MEQRVLLWAHAHKSVLSCLQLLHSCCKLEYEVNVGLYAEAWVNLRLENILSSSFPFLGWLLCPTILLLNLLADSFFFFIYCHFPLFFPSVWTFLSCCPACFLLEHLSVSLDSAQLNFRRLIGNLKTFVICLLKNILRHVAGAELWRRQSQWPEGTSQVSDPAFGWRQLLHFACENFSLLPNSLPHLTFLHFIQLHLPLFIFHIFGLLSLLLSFISQFVTERFFSESPSPLPFKILILL